MVKQRLLQGTSLLMNTPPRSANQKTFLTLDGSFDGNAASFGISSDMLSKHMLFLGQSGSGKTTAICKILKQIKKKMTQKDVMIIFDTKGDYYKCFYDKKTDCVIGNSDQFIDISERINVYKEIFSDGFDNNHVLLNASEIAKSMFQDRRSHSYDPFFASAAEQLLSAILVSIARLSMEDKAFLIQNLYNDRLKAYINSSNWKDLCDLLSCFPDLSYISNYINGDNGQSQGVMSELYSVLNDLMVGVFASHGGFSIRHFVRRRGSRTLFIEYDLAIGNILSPVYSLLTDLALKEALSRHQPEGNVYIVCDELKLLPSVTHLENALNFGRSLGVKIIAGLQSVSQIYEVYGKDRGQNILSGFGNTICFRTNDPISRTFVSGQYGQNMVSEYLMANNNMKEAIRIGNTIEEWHYNDLHVGEAIVGLAFSPPFKFSFKP